jgi:hypothetical protein
MGFLGYDSTDFRPEASESNLMNNSARRASIYLGIFMAVVLLAGVFLPLLQNNTTTTQELPNPTSTPLPTFPPPPADLTAITFDKLYLHPSGIFAIGQPDGWTATEPSRGATIAQVNLVNNASLAVVDSYIEDPAAPISAADLSAHFSEQAINSSWANFTSWTESNRVLENDQLTLDFTITLQGRTYVARQRAWTDGDWIYVVRVLVPENATELLRYLLDNFASSLRPFNEFKGMPLNWSAYYDPNFSHIIRYPQEWTVTDSAPGRPTSISSRDGILLRVEARPETAVADEAAATAFVESTRSGVSIVSVEPVERGLGAGFSVAYSYTTVDGSPESGLAVLLNGADGTLHIANLMFPAANVDLNNLPEDEVAPEATAEATEEAPVIANIGSAYSPLAQVVESFYVLAPLNLSADSLPATATPMPTFAPTVAVTAEATVEAESTEAAAEEAPADATAEAEATAEATAAS